MNSITCHCYKILKDIGSIKSCFQKEHLESLVHAVVSGRLDYCNSLLINISKENLNKLQKLQNAAARLVLGRRRRESAVQALRDLHWLNIEKRIIFKILLLVFKVLKGMCSDNLKLTYKQFNGRSHDFLKLETPTFKTKFGERTFEYNGSRLWNALPYELRTIEDVKMYKKKVKTFI